MIENIASKNRIELQIDTSYHNKLDISGFAQMMKNPSYCYKFLSMRLLRCASEHQS